MFLGHNTDRQHVQALWDCKQRDDKLLDLFAKQLDEVKNLLIAADDTDRILRLQGQASVLRDFLDAVEKSQEVLERRKP
ncbi:MAG: hypothetical protein VW715_08420 [Rhodospirillales bacterium]|jgi:hypothetical protein